MLETKRVFLTGIGGFLGSHVAFKLQKEGHQVLGLIRSNNHPTILKGIPVTYYKGDLLAPDSYEDALKKCDIVIHTAAVSSFGLRQTGLYYKVNYEGTKALLAASRRNGIKRFIHTGTRGTLGVASRPEESDETYENKNIDKADDYIKSKYMAEKEVIKYSKCPDMRCVILSPTALVGVCDYRPTPASRVILSFLNNKIRVYADGGLNLIDVEDAGCAFVSALEKGRNGEIYILGNANMTLQELFLRLSRLSGVPMPKIKMPFFLAYASSFIIEGLSKLTGRPPFATPKKVVSLYNNCSYCKSFKAIQELDLPQTPIVDTLKKIVAWHNDGLYKG